MRPVVRRTLRVGTWNLRVGRDRDKVVAEVAELLKEQDLDVLLVCEAAHYAKALRNHYNGDPKGRTAAARRGRQDYRWLGFADAVTEKRDSGILVRRNLRHSDSATLHRLSAGWIRAPKHRRLGFHEPRWMVSAAVAGVQFYAVHTPPGPFGDGEYRSRKLANLTAFDRLARLGRGRNRRSGARWVMGGDFNRLKGDGVVREFARVADADLHGSGIDYFATHGVQVTGEAREINHGASDHDPKVMEIAY